MMNKHSKVLRMMCVAGLLITITTSITGCGSMRKKFIRKKKITKRNEIIPILEPIDYAETSHTTEEMYGRSYAMWKIWHKEMEQTITSTTNDKRHRYLYTQMREQAEKIKILLNEEKIEAIDSILDGITQIENEFKKSKSIRQLNRVKAQLRIIGKTMRLEMNPKVVQDYLK
ncbi:MAG: hypothetical protein ACI9F2_000662 [Lysobacterales bacterium]|jgi:hypothetical protein